MTVHVKTTQCHRDNTWYMGTTLVTGTTLVNVQLHVYPKI